MATLSDSVFRFLALCAQKPGCAAVGQQLSSALSSISSFDELAAAAEEHGMEPLVLAHIERRGLSVPDALRARLHARWSQHAHARAVRSRLLGDVGAEMAHFGVPFLVLKGAALAHLVYEDPRLRPMRDVDLLLRKTDARRAVDVLARFGFRPTGVERYHHLPPMARTHDGATITIELHHKLLFRIPFVPPRGYDDLIDRSQGFDWGAMTCRALGNEDMLWHVYAHAFVSMPLLPGAIRLLSVADLVHATEACVDRLDWVRIGREYPRLVRALHIVDDLVPWSPHVVQVLREHTQRSPARVRARPIPSDRFWSLRLLPNVLWLQEWWFRMRYGITSWPRWAWYRFVGHPAHLALPAGEAIMRRLRKRFFARPTSMS